MRTYLITVLSLLLVLFCLFGLPSPSEKSAEAGGCSNQPAYGGNGPMYFFSFMQNNSVYDSSDSLTTSIAAVSGMLSWIPPSHPPYEVAMPNSMYLVTNLLYSGPNSIVDAYTGDLWRDVLCSYNVTRVATPHTLMIDPDGSGYRLSEGFASRVCLNPNEVPIQRVDQYWAIFVPRVSPATWTPTLLAHELGHSVLLNHMNIQDGNVMWGGVNPCGSMNGAIDNTQSYYYQSFPCATTAEGGQFYPHPDNPLYGIPTPVQYCP